MAERNGQRERVEPGIWRRADAQGRPVYEITFRDSDGRQRRRTVKGGIRTARTALAEVKANMGKGKRVAPAPRLTFGHAAEQWKQSQMAALRPATRDAYGSSLKNHLLPRWERRRLDSIDVDDVARLISQMHDAGLRAWTIRGVLTVAGRVFDFARRRLGWAGENPVRLLDRSERPQSDARERRVLTGDELERLLAAADDRHRPIFALAAGTGARLGETLGLKWRCVDLDAGSVSITHQLDRRGAHVELKTRRSRRVVELPAPVAAMLRERKLASPRSRPGDYVFTTRDGRALEHRNVAGRALGRAVATAQLEAPAPTFHSFRHGFASAWIAAGGDLVELSAHLGHRDPAVTASVYSHEFEKSARSDQRRARLDGMFAGSMAALGAASGDASPTTAARPATAQVAALQAKRDTRR